MSQHTNPPVDMDSVDPEGGILRGLAGGVAGMLVSVLALLLCVLFGSGELGCTFQLFVGLVVGWFYRLFRGRRSKAAAYGIVGACTVLACALWVAAAAVLSIGVSPAELTAADWGRLWENSWGLLLLCAGMGLVGFFCTRKSLLIYADWMRGPWHMAYSYAGGAMYNLLPERLPAQAPPDRFVVRDRFSTGTRIIVEGNALRWKRPLCRAVVCSVPDIAGVVLGPSGGCNVVYDRNYRILAKFAASMERADVLLLWLFQRGIPIDKVPAGWRVSDNAGEGGAYDMSQRKFSLRLKKSARQGFMGIGCFLLAMGVLLFLVFLFSRMTVVERWAMGVLELAVMGMALIYLRMGRTCGVEVDGEQMRVTPRIGRTAAFSVREVSSISRSVGWILLCDREWKTLAKIDPYLEDLDTLKNYLESYGITW